MMAKDRSADQLRTIALQHFSQHSSVDGRHKAPQKMDARETMNLTMLSIYGADGHGFVVLSKDESLEPILGFSSHSFDADDMPCGLQWWLEATDMALQSRLRAPRRDDMPTSFIPVDNFLPAQWGQNDPFNALCPEVNGKRPPSGCVATAMAQLLYFYRYPAQGQGKGWYTISNSSRMTQTISSTYDWDAMLDVYKLVKISDEQREAVATLMRDAGYGCHMNYDAKSSGAYISTCTASFVDNFSYDPLSIRCYHRDYFSTDEWMGMIQDELLAGRPVLYAGADKSHGGHAFIFSGINEKGLVYVNWGWNGDADGYYDIRSLNPTGILGTSYIYAFTESQQMIVGLKAQPNADEGEIFETHIIMNEPFTAKLFGRNYLQMSVDVIYNVGYRDFSGEIGFYVVSDDGDESKSLFVPAYDNTTGEILAPGYGDHMNSKLQSMASLPEGGYRLFMAAKAVDQEQIDLMRAPGGIYCIPFTIKEDGSLELGEGEILDAIHDIKITHFSDVSTDGMTRVYDASGRMVYSAPSQRFNLWDVSAHGLLFVKEGANVRKVIR